MAKFKETNNFIVDLREKKSSEQPLRYTSGGQVRNWLHFIKYNNAFLVVLIIGVIAFSGLAMASEDVRDATIGGKQVYAEGVDNTLLLEVDLDNFSMDFKITGIMEDEESYLVTYSYVDLLECRMQNAECRMQMLEIGDEGASWQYIEREAVRKISKPFRKDLGLYLAEELGEEAKARIKELKKLQKQAQEEGQTKIVQVTEYSGLIGKVLDLSSKMFPGYEPVKKVELATPEVDEQVQQRVSSGDNLAEVYEEWVEEHPDQMSDVGFQNSEVGDQIGTTTTPETISETATSSETGVVEPDSIVPESTGVEESTLTPQPPLPEGEGETALDEVIDEVVDINGTSTESSVE